MFSQTVSPDPLHHQYIEGLPWGAQCFLVDDGKVVHHTSGASPRIHLPSGVKVSGELTRG